MPRPGLAPPCVEMEEFSRGHAVLMLSSCGLAATLGSAWPVGAAACVSFGVWLARGADAWTPTGGFGMANFVTLLRLALTVAASAGAAGLPGLWLGIGLGLVWALDGIDGWLARRRGQASAFGAHFDMEVDALLVLIAELVLWQRGDAGVWILCTGLLRYLYVIALWVAPARAGEMPRQLSARLAFGLLVAGCIATFAWPAGGAFAAAGGTLAVGASFTRGFHWSYARSVEADVTRSSRAV